MEKLPLLLCPGLLNDAFLWRHQVEHLADLAVPRVMDLTREREIAALAERLLAEAPPRFALAGLSMGGYVAFEILRRAPERVAKLALVNTSARPDSAESAARRHQLMEIARRGGFDKLPRQILEGQLAPASFADASLLAAALGMAGRVGAEGFINQQTAILSRPDSRPTLAAIRCPTLVIGGAQDSLTTPAIMAEIADGIKGAAFTLIEGAGHLTPLEQPVAVTALLRLWLRG
ncbi:3-oxoadipate enol-lactonase 2 [mine drainage metagenome]|uniref:3-oxoadipate enol-lactonase 2 n=1 Tax=mine drainage metagenome TaxID=410659 RepID=A0A1J5RIF5_9ZZZZ